jgi:hypothetical protein
MHPRGKTCRSATCGVAECIDMGICNYHGLVEPFQLAIADMYVIVDGAMMYIALDINKDLLLD